jgi:hypothetical protein
MKWNFQAIQTQGAALVAALVFLVIGSGVALVQAFARIA